MKKVMVIGGTGRIGRLLIEYLNKQEISLHLYVRNKEKAEKLGLVADTICEGDVLDTKQLSEQMRDQDYVVAILSGDLLSYAKSIAEALSKNKNVHMIWITGMGIHHEVPGEVGKLLDKLCEQMPEYVQAADEIENSGNSYTLIRAAHLTDGDNEKYFTQHEGEVLHANSVDRVAVAHLISDLIQCDNKEEKSIGVTN